MPFNPMDFFQAGTQAGQAQASPFAYGAQNVMDQFKMSQQLQMQLAGQLGLKNAENQLPMNPVEANLKNKMASYYGGDDSSKNPPSLDDNGNPVGGPMFSGGIKNQQLQLQKYKFSQEEWNKVSDLSNPVKASSRSTLGMASNANLRADRARATLNSPMATNQDAQNIFADIAGIYAGGSPTDIGMQEGSYTSLQQKAMGVVQGLTGKPMDSLPPEFKKHILGVLDDLQGTNNNLIKSHFDYQEKKNPWVINQHKSEWEGMKSSMLPNQQNSFVNNALGGNNADEDSKVAGLLRTNTDPAVQQAILKTYSQRHNGREYGK